MDATVAVVVTTEGTRRRVKNYLIHKGEHWLYLKTNHTCLFSLTQKRSFEMGKDSFLGKGPISIFFSLGGGGLGGLKWNLIHLSMLVLRCANPSVFKSRKFGLWKHFAEAMLVKIMHFATIKSHTCHPWNHAILYNGSLGRHLWLTLTRSNLLELHNPRFT